MARTVVGYFRDRGAADRAYDALQQRGFGKDEISIIGRGADGKTETVTFPKALQLKFNATKFKKLHAVPY